MKQTRFTELHELRWQAFEAAMADQFMANWARYTAGDPLDNLVDKSLGFVPSA